MSTLSIWCNKSDKLRKTNLNGFLNDFVMKKAVTKAFQLLLCDVQPYLIVAFNF